MIDMQTRICRLLWPLGHLYEALSFFKFISSVSSNGSGFLSILKWMYPSKWSWLGRVFLKGIFLSSCLESLCQPSVDQEAVYLRDVYLVGMLIWISSACGIDVVCLTSWKHAGCLFLRRLKWFLTVVKIFVCIWVIRLDITFNLS